MMAIGVLSILQLAVAPRFHCRPWGIGRSDCWQRLQRPALGLFLGLSGEMHSAEELRVFGIAGVTTHYSNIVGCPSISHLRMPLQAVWDCRPDVPGNIELLPSEKQSGGWMPQLRCNDCGPTLLRNTIKLDLQCFQQTQDGTALQKNASLKEG